MYCHINQPDSNKWEVIDLYTGSRIPGIQEANDETGEFTIIMKDLITGEWITNERGEPAEFQFKGYIQLIYKGE